MMRPFALVLERVTGCANMMARSGVNMTAPAIQRASQNFAAESDPDLARAAAPGQLKTADGFLAMVPDNEILLEVCAQGYIEYAFGFLEDDYESLPDGAQKDSTAKR